MTRCLDDAIAASATREPIKSCRFHLSIDALGTCFDVQVKAVFGERIRSVSDVAKGSPAWKRILGKVDLGLTVSPILQHIRYAIVLQKDSLLGDRILRTVVDEGLKILQGEAVFRCVHSRAGCKSFMHAAGSIDAGWAVRHCSASPVTGSHVPQHFTQPCCFPCGDAFPGSPELPMLVRGWRMTRAEQTYFPDDQDPLQAISVETKDVDVPDHSSEFGIIIFTCLVTVVYLVVQVRNTCHGHLMTPENTVYLICTPLRMSCPLIPTSLFYPLSPNRTLCGDCIYNTSCSCGRLEGYT